MIKQILAMVLALGLMLPVGILPAPAQAAVVVGTGFAEETITVSTAAIGITAALCTVRGRQTAALVEVKTNAIYYTLDDPAATPDSGDYEAALGTVISIPKANYLRMIRQTADSSVKVTCFRGGQLPAESSVDKSGAGVSGSGVILTSFEYAEDVPHVSGDSGAFMLGVMNEDASTFGNIDDDYTGIATDRGWQQLVVPKYSTGVAAPLQLGKREDLPSAVSDAGMNVMVIRDDALIADAGTDNDLDYMSLRSDNFGALWGTLTDGAGGQLVQFEDGVAASGSPGIQALAVINSGFTTPAADSDYVPLQLSGAGFLYNLPMYDATVNGNTRAITREDNASAAFDAGFVVFSTRLDTLVSGAGAQDGDYINFKSDLYGSLWNTATDGAGNILAQIEDVVHVTGDPGILALAITNEALATLAAADGDYSGIAVDSQGQVFNAELGPPGMPANNTANVSVTYVGNFASYWDGSTWDLVVGTAEDGALVNLGSNNDVVATAGLLHANSPTTEVATVSLFAAGDIADTNLGASAAIGVTGSGDLSQVCLVFTVGTVTQIADLTVHFFDADPAISENTADMTVAEALTVVAKADITNFSETGVAQVGCIADVGHFHSITHVVLENTHGAALSDEAVSVHVWYRRDA